MEDKLTTNARPTCLKDTLLSFLEAAVVILILVVVFNVFATILPYKYESYTGRVKILDAYLSSNRSCGYVDVECGGDVVTVEDKAAYYKFNSKLGEEVPAEIHKSSYLGGEQKFSVVFK